MNEEEKKAIEELKQLKKDFEIVDKIVKDRDKQETKTIDAILNLIEKQNKIIETNKENWLLVQNEVLGYAQGYEDGKQHKQTATAMVVENRKYQIIGEEIKRYKAIIEKQQKELEKKDSIIDLMAKEIEDETTMDKYCNREDCYADEYIDGHCQKCLNCIIRYFTKKAEVKENERN